MKLEAIGASRSVRVMSSWSDGQTYDVTQYNEKSFCFAMKLEAIGASRSVLVMSNWSAGHLDMFGRALSQTYNA